MATLRFLSVICTAIVLAGGLAHLFELPNKVRLPADAYLNAQRLYRGWQLLGIPLLGALGTTAVLALRSAGATYYLIVGAALCLALNVVVFFAVTFPVNRKTENWTRLPADWEALRRRWEYSHAFNAVLAFVALCLLVLSLVRQS
jgi:hypothetical protein